jgi:uncharacterized protein (TIGR00304 family)
MNKYQILALISIILAIAFFALSEARGEDSVYILIFIPVFHINSILSGLGALFLILAFIFYFLSFTSGFELVGWDELQDELSDRPRQRAGESGTQPQQQPRKRMNIQGGGVVFIGPIPIIFGSNQKITLITVILALTIMVLAILFFYFQF